jgi:uncharacterized protein YlxW (UPF0749 family)
MKRLLLLVSLPLAITVGLYAADAKTSVVKPAPLTAEEKTDLLKLRAKSAEAQAKYFSLLAQIKQAENEAQTAVEIYNGKLKSRLPAGYSFDDDLNFIEPPKPGK